MPSAFRKKLNRALQSASNSRIAELIKENPGTAGALGGGALGALLSKNLKGTAIGAGLGSLAGNAAIPAVAPPKGSGIMDTLWYNRGGAYKTGLGALVGLPILSRMPRAVIRAAVKDVHKKSTAANSLFSKEILNSASTPSQESLRRLMGAFTQTAPKGMSVSDLHKLLKTKPGKLRTEIGDVLAKIQSNRLDSLDRKGAVLLGDLGRKLGGSQGGRYGGIAGRKLGEGLRAYAKLITEPLIDASRMALPDAKTLLASGRWTLPAMKRHSNSILEDLAHRAELEKALKKMRRNSPTQKKTKASPKSNRRNGSRGNNSKTQAPTNPGAEKQVDIDLEKLREAYRTWIQAQLVKTPAASTNPLVNSIRNQVGLGTAAKQPAASTNPLVNSIRNQVGLGTAAKQQAASTNPLVNFIRNQVGLGTAANQTNIAAKPAASKPSPKKRTKMQSVSLEDLNPNGFM